METGATRPRSPAAHPARSGRLPYLLQDEDGQTIESHSISAGLDYPGVGPEHAYLGHRPFGYRPITDTEAMDALALLSRREGIIPAIESAHAVADALQLGQELGEGAIIVVSLSGRGDKDVDTAGRWFNLFDPPPSENDVHAIDNAGETVMSSESAVAETGTVKAAPNPGSRRCSPAVRPKAAPPSSGICPSAIPPSRSRSNRSGQW